MTSVDDPKGDLTQTKVVFDLDSAVKKLVDAQVATDRLCNHSPHAIVSLCEKQKIRLAIMIACSLCEYYRKFEMATTSLAQ